MAKEFKVGDIVQLKSGGPKMTVHGVDVSPGMDEPRVWCVWFAGSKRQLDRFSVNTLVLVPEKDPAK